LGAWARTLQVVKQVISIVENDVDDTPKYASDGDVESPGEHVERSSRTFDLNSIIAAHAHSV
jgi:hypothetical protein